MTIDIEKLAEEHLTPFARTGWTAYGEQLKQFAEAYAVKVLEDKEREITRLTFISTTLKDNIDELQAHINDLREDFRKIRSCYGDGYEVDNIARQALSKTPAQSLQEHDNEVVERCAKAAEKNGNGITAKTLTKCWRITKVI